MNSFPRREGGGEFELQERGEGADSLRDQKGKEKRNNNGRKEIPHIGGRGRLADRRRKRGDPRNRYFEQKRREGWDTFSPARRRKGKKAIRVAEEKRKILP